MIGIALLLAILPLLSSLFPSSEAQYVLIETPEGSMAYPCQTDREIPVSVGGYALTVRIADGAVSVAASSCENLICVHTAPIRRAGQSIVCAPAQLVIRIRAEGGSDADWILP